MRFAFPVGLRYMASSAFFFSLMSVFVKVAGQRLPSMEIVMARSVVGLTISAWFVRRSGVGFRGVRRRMLILRGIFGFVALACFYYALVHLPLADATVIQYTNPVWTVLLAAAFIGEGVRLRQIGLALLSLCGVLLVARPTFLFGGSTTPLDPFAVGVGLVAALFSALAYITVRVLRKTENPMVIVFWFALVSTTASIPFTVPVALVPTPIEVLALLGVGVCTHIGQWSLTHGLMRERAGRAISVGYLQIVFAAVWGILFFAEIPGLLSIAGAVLIIASVLRLGREEA